MNRTRLLAGRLPLVLAGLLVLGALAFWQQSGQKPTITVTAMSRRPSASTPATTSGSSACRWARSPRSSSAATASR